MYRNLLLMYLNLYWKTEGKVDNKTQKAKNMMNLNYFSNISKKIYPCRIRGQLCWWRHGAGSLR